MENSDLEWKSYMYNLPKGVLSFATRACIDVLPTGDNLKKWGKKVSEECSLCGNNETLHHTLNFCPTSLAQGRYTFRHNQIVTHLVKFLKDNNSSISVFADLEGHTINGGTVPPQVIPTQEKPDIVVIKSDHVFLIELSVPFETNIDKARSYKMDRYASLLNDIKDNGFKCDLICLEVGSRGLVTKDNKLSIRSIAKIVGTKKVRDLWRDVSRIAVLGSYAIFNARFASQWVDFRVSI